MNFQSFPRAPARAPIFNVPGVLVAMVVVLAGVHLARQWLPEASDLRLLRELAYVPARIWTVLDPSVIARQLASTSSDAAEQQRTLLAQFFVGHGGLKPWTLLSYGLLHGNFSHLLLNLLWLVAFGAPVARRLGAVRFIALIVVASVAGAAAHTLVHPYDVEPVIGASAAVSGVVGAALRFVFQPGEPLAALRAGESEAPGVRPARLLRFTEILRNRQAASFLVIWFVSNFLFGVLAVPLGISEQGIAWEAHIGGFLAGLLLLPLFDRKQPIAG